MKENNHSFLDKAFNYYYIFIFFSIVIIIASIVMGGLFLVNNAVQNSEGNSEENIKEKEMVEELTISFWNEFKVVIPFSILLLILSFIIKVKYFNKTQEVK